MVIKCLLLNAYFKGEGGPVRGLQPSKPIVPCAKVASSKGRVRLDGGKVHPARICLDDCYQQNNKLPYGGRIYAR